MERYNEYKESGVYFIPDIPNSWQVLKAKYLFKQEKREVRPEDEIVTCFRDGQVTLRKNRRTEGFTNSMKEIGYQGVRKGDLVIHNMDAFAGAIGVSDSDGKGTPVYACCTPKRNDINQYYYCYLLRYLARNGFILSLAKGIRERSTDFRFNDFKELYLPVPSKEEQDAIVSYIDLQSTKIDEAIAQQQKMINLLNERKQIIINNAVTKGLNPDAPMKDSGVDWIGVIPEHWELMPLKRCCELVREKCIKAASFRVALENIESWSGTYIDTTSEYDGLGVQFKKGDILFGKLRPYLAKVYLAEKDGEALGDIWTLRSNSSCFSGYIHKILLSKKIIDVIDSSTYGTKMPRADWGTNSKLCIPVPPFSEQETITSFLDSISFKIECAISNATNQISLLQERKQIIINDVVTGKVKVS